MSHQQMGARICKFELSGESNIYVCPRDEYCCNVGCCIPPSIQFYQLWYYWFMLFFLLLVCSGGQWWYKYMVQGRCASAMPPPPRRTSYPRQCRVAYTPARDTVVLHHLWKPPYTGMSGAPPAYSQSGPVGSSTSAPKTSPYIQLYGPPPSYESVVAAGPAPVHHLSANGGQFDLATSGSSQVGAEGTSQDLHHSATVNIAAYQQLFKPSHSGQHHRQLSLGAASGGQHQVELANSGSCHASIEGSGQDIQVLAGSGHQHFKPGHHHRASSMGTNGANFEIAGSSTSHPNLDRGNQDLHITLHQHSKPGVGHHHRLTGSGHNSTVNAHHQHGEYTISRPNSAHIHHYHPHHTHHRQPIQQSGVEQTSVAPGGESSQAQPVCEFVPPPPLQDDQLELQGEGDDSKQVGASLPLVSTPARPSTQTASTPQQP